jgi:inorganic pyrophosphatase/exopolyphosphatase
MADLVEHIRGILEHHRIDEQSSIADVGCSCGVVNLADHHRHVAQQLVDRLELRREAVGSKTRYVSAWFDDELTKLEGAE